MADRKKMVTAVFCDRADAQSAHDRLLARGYPAEEINVLMSSATQEHYVAAERHGGRLLANSAAVEGMGVGGAIGTAVGATLAAVMAIGTSLVVPGLGMIVAGPVAAAFAGGGAGAVAGGIIGGLVGAGIPEPNAFAYQEVLRAGGVILGVVPHSEDDADAIMDDFKELHGESVC